MRVYDPPENKAFKTGLSHYGRRAWLRAGFTTRFVSGPLRLDLLAVLPRPKSMPGRDLAWHAVRPDEDNIRKAVLDGMDWAWGDDAQVCAGSTTKAYSEPNGSPRLVIRLEQVAGDGPADAKAIVQAGRALADLMAYAQSGEGKGAA